MSNPQANPFASVQQFFTNAALAVQQHPLAQHASNQLKTLQQKQRIAFQTRSGDSHRPPPRMVVLPRHSACAAIIPGDTIAEQVLTNGLNNFLNLYNTALICRLVLTWFPNPPEVIVGPLSTICDPYLNIFRGLLPPLGGTIDLSPILAFVLLNLVTSTAAALPCEVDPQGRPLAGSTTDRSSGASHWLHISKGERLWHKRVASQKAKQAGQDS